MATRRRRGEDGISFEHRGPCRDPDRHRHCPGLWRGEFTLGYTGDGTRTRRKVSGKTKAAVVDKLRQLHHELDQGIVPKTGYANYTVRQAANDWLATGLVFTNHLGAALDAGNVRKMFKRICTEAGAGDGWTPRELRTTFVSLLSHRGVSIEEIARLAGHASTRTTEIVYRRELRPVITTGAEIMDELFGAS